jgi:molybdate transport system ATP-binding protein
VSDALVACIAAQLGAFAFDVDLQVPGAGVTAVVGPSGSGKSTLLRCLAGLESRARGAIRLGDETWLDSNRRVFVPPHKRGAAVVFQDAAPFSHLSVRGNLEYGLSRCAPERRSVAFDEATQWLRIESLLDRHTDALSGGERQRVAIARALLAGPRLLLLDEPLASLDPPARAEILEVLRDVFARTRMPVLYVTHARSEAVHVADHVVVLDRGRVRASGPLREIALRADMPFGEPAELGAIVEAQVAAVDERDAISELRFAGGVLYVSGCLRIGERRRVEILARDVSVSLEAPQRTSILNVLPARVVAIEAAESAQPLVRVDIGGTQLLARVSRRSLGALELREGTAVYVSVKAVAVIP